MPKHGYPLGVPPDKSQPISNSLKSKEVKFNGAGNGPRSVVSSDKKNQKSR